MPTSTDSTTRRTPKAGDSIHVASDPWGREQGVCYVARVDAVEDTLIHATVSLPETGTAEGEPATETSAAIAAEADQWHWPEAK